MKLDPQVLEDLLIWQASDLARRKKYPEAEAILGLLEISEGKNRSAACDLLGKIRAKQGQYAEARAYFQKAIALNPENLSPREALDGLPGYIRKRQTRKLTGVIVPIMTLVIAISLFLWLAHPDSNKSSPVKSNTGVPNVNRPETGLPIHMENVAFQGEMHWPTFDNVDIISTQTPSEMRIVFKQGVFAEKCALTADGLRLTSLVAERIKQSKERYFVIIEGHTDNIPVYSGSSYKDNLHLGLSRAETIMRLFSSEYGLDKEMLLPISAGENSPLFSNNHENEKHKNRTVTIRILPIRVEKKPEADLK
jgi:flagellar motor protein MotB